MFRLISVIGARPQFIKAAALSRAIRNRYSDKIEDIIVHTGQHYDPGMSDVFFNEMEISKPRFSLEIGPGKHGEQTGRMLLKIEEVLMKEKPDAVLVYGDTNSTLAASLAASKIHIPVIHVEAGLRSFNKSMPEELNRILSDHVSTLLFAPTQTAVDNLKAEGITSTGDSRKAGKDSPLVFHCGDVMYDNHVYYSAISSDKTDIIKRYDLTAGGFHLLTVHRDTNTDDPVRLKSILSAILQLADSGEKFVFPVHPRTLKMLESSHNDELNSKVRGHKNIILIPPASFFEILELEKNCKMIFTDSGGVQKEAFFNKKPCIVLRAETEWKELVETGNVTLTDADSVRILDSFQEFSNRKDFSFPPLYGDGHAAEFICEKILSTL